MIIEYWCRSNGSSPVIDILEEIRADDPELHDQIWSVVEEFEKDGMELGKNRRGMIEPVPPHKNLYELRPYGYRIFFTLRDSRKTAYLVLMCKKQSQKARKSVLKTAFNRANSIK